MGGVRVLQLSWSDLGGGAARSAWRLHVGLRAQGVDSRLLVADRRAADASVTVHQGPRGWGQIGAALVRRAAQAALRLPWRYTRSPTLEAWSEDRACHGVPSGAAEGFDLVHLHWVAGLIEWTDFLPGTSAPLVWTLHDMNPFTGGCHYDQGCGRWLERCGGCPQLGSRWERDLSRVVWRRKARALSRLAPGALTVVAPSRWLAACARQSGLFRRLRVETIPYGLDHVRLSPRPRAAARARWGLPTGARAALFVAHDLSNPRKGLEPLRAALEALRDDPDAWLVTVGASAPSGPLPVKHRHLGQLTGESELADAYAAADLLVAPSLQDNLPNTVLEAMSCGVPSVGFAVGGLPDLVTPGQTGLLAEPGDAPALGRSLRRLLDDPGLRARLGAACRAQVEREHTLAVQASRYQALYSDVLGKVTPARAAR